MWICYAVTVVAFGPVLYMIISVGIKVTRQDNDGKPLALQKVYGWMSSMLLATGEDNMIVAIVDRVLETLPYFFRRSNPFEWH